MPTTRTAAPVVGLTALVLALGATPASADILPSPDPLLQQLTGALPTVSPLPLPLPSLSPSPSPAPLPSLSAPAPVPATSPTTAPLSGTTGGTTSGGTTRAAAASSPQTVAGPAAPGQVTTQAGPAYGYSGSALTGAAGLELRVGSLNEPPSLIAGPRLASPVLPHLAPAPPTTTQALAGSSTGPADVPALVTTFGILSVLAAAGAQVLVRRRA